ncbi:MAG: hypothetical protein AVO33_07650 [delta proteobacterium ML8_F1]|nr:MAG: hypothetical protein AVO33_07650 [delta proteobacterium ML8_F1]
MEEIRALIRKIIIWTLWITGGLSILSLIILDDPLPMIQGLVFGTLLGGLNFYDLALTLEKASRMPPEKARGYATKKYLIRFVLMAVALWVSIRGEHIHVLGTVAGLLLVKMVIYVTNLVNDRRYYLNIFKRKEDK